MKAGWSQRKIDDICDFRGGGTPSKANENYWRGEIPWVSPKDMKSDVITDSIDHISANAIEESTTNLIPSGSVLVVVRSGILARTVPVAITGKEVAINQDIKALCPDKSVDSWFLFYFLKSRLEEMLALASRGATVHRIMADQIRAMEIPIPPLAEQQRIVAVLDEAFAGLATAQANAEKNLQNAHAVFESHLNAVFSQCGKGWMEKTLVQIGTTQTGSTPNTSDRSNYGSVIPFIKPGDFNPNGTLNYDNEGLSKSGLELARTVTANSALMVCIGATIGKCGYCDRDVTTNQQINAFTPHSGINPFFIYYQMLTDDFQRRVRLNSGQATLPIISKGKWSALAVRIPPTLPEQEHMVNQLDALASETQRLQKIYEQKLAALAELKKSLLHQAFSGEL